MMTRYVTGPPRLRTHRLEWGRPVGLAMEAGPIPITEIPFGTIFLASLDSLHFHESL